MHKIFLFSLLIITTSFSVMACPDLTGDYYKCTSGNLETDEDTDLFKTLKVSQTKADNKLTYSLDDGTKDIDNFTVGQTTKSNEEIDEDTLLELTTSPSCKDQQLILNIKSEFKRSKGSELTEAEFSLLQGLVEELLGDFKSTIKLDKNKNLVIDQNLFGDQITIKCKRK